MTKTYTEAFNAWWQDHWAMLGARRPGVESAFRAGWDAANAHETAPSSNERSEVERLRDVVEQLRQEMERLKAESRHSHEPEKPL